MILSQFKRQQALTLIELLMVLSIIGLLLAASPPWLSDTVKRSRVSAATKGLFSGLQSARNHARLHYKEYSLCGSDDGIHCQNSWTKELILFEDVNRNDTLDDGEAIYHFPVNARGLVIQSRIGFGRQHAQFNQRGYAGVSGSFLICDLETPRQILRKVTWNQIGRPYVLRTQKQIKKHSSIECWND